MTYLGDVSPGDVIDLKFATIAGSPATLSGSPVISVYKDNSTTESTAGVTLTVDFDSRTGLNNVHITTVTDGTFYSAGSNFQVVITTGTVGSVSAVGYVVGQFSIQNRSALRPTTAGRTLDVSATGEAGVDWANVGSPTTSLALTGTTIAVTQKVDVDTIKTNPVVNGGTLTFPTTATLASTTNITAGTITTTTNLTNAPTSGDLTAAMKTSVTTAATASTPTVTLAAAAVQAIWDALTAALTTAGSIGKKLADWTIGTAQTGDSFARLGAPVGASISADVAGVPTALLDLANGVETSVTLRQAQRVQLAAAAGKVDGAATTTVHLRDQADSKNRVTATVDADGNRTAVTLDLS